MEKEANKLEVPEGQPSAWDFSKVDSKAEAMKRAREKQIEYHAGFIEALSRIKDYEHDENMWIYEGRIVSRGDLVKDGTGHEVAFYRTEHMCNLRAMLQPI